MSPSELDALVARLRDAMSDLRGADFEVSQIVGDFRDKEITKAEKKVRDCERLLDDAIAALRRGPVSAEVETADVMVAWRGLGSWVALDADTAQLLAISINAHVAARLAAHREDKS